MDFAKDLLDDIQIALTNSFDYNLDLFDRVVYRLYLMVYIAILLGVGSIGGAFLLYGGEVILRPFFH